MCGKTGNFGRYLLRPSLFCFLLTSLLLSLSLVSPLSAQTFSRHEKLYTETQVNELNQLLIQLSQDNEELNQSNQELKESTKELKAELSIKKQLLIDKEAQSNEVEKQLSELKKSWRTHKVEDQQTSAGMFIAGTVVGIIGYRLLDLFLFGK